MGVTGLAGATGSSVPATCGVTLLELIVVMLNAGMLYVDVLLGLCWFVACCVLDSWLACRSCAPCARNSAETLHVAEYSY